MASRRQSSSPPETTRRKLATTPEGREQQIASLAYDLAEQRLRDGSASAQEVTYFLKAASMRETLERERLQHENQLTQAKIDAMAAQQRIEELYKEALQAMSAYSGHVPQPESDDGYEG